NDYERIKTGDYNSFVGSLESLKDLTKLKKLYISNTDIAGDLRYLPEEVYCSSEGRPESKVKSVEEALKNFESFTFNEGKYTRKKQAYFFREDNFKNFLRRNATKTWFSRNTANARYKSRAGVCELHDYIDKYTVEVKGVLIDPGVKIDEMINQAQQMDMMVHMNAMVCNSIANIGNAFSGGISVSPAITAPSPKEVPKFASPEVQVSEPVDNLISDFSQQLTITPTDYEEKNEEGIERMEQEITKLEEEISKLKLEQKQKQQQTQIEIPPK
ncbi:33821_t:CDS:2, partial [Racocetra persica]